MSEFKLHENFFNLSMIKNIEQRADGSKIIVTILKLMNLINKENPVKAPKGTNLDKYLSFKINENIDVVKSAILILDLSGYLKYEKENVNIAELDIESLSKGLEIYGN